jgi:NAD(P)-dependent dehydrogenase (short-subunit alcohol dehydrogenase family)
VFGTLALTQAVARQMVPRGAGRIIIMSSIAGLVSGPAFGPYSMSKHALQAMGSCLRTELGRHGIDVTLICPGPYATGFNERIAGTMWQWFDSGATQGGDVDRYRAISDAVTTDQLDPDAVIQALADLSEARQTPLQTVLPPDMVDELRSALEQM